VHVESSMLIPSEFARLAVNHGTVATISDPHEIANVCGVEGVEYMIDNAAKVPFKFHFGAPSCVPATSFETAGDVIEFRIFDTFRVADAVSANDANVNFAGNLSVGGNVTAAYFIGNGSQLTYVNAGFGIPVNDTDKLFNYVSAAGTVTANLVLDATNAGVNSSYVIATTPTITVASGIGVTVQTGKTLVIDVLRLEP